MKNKEYKTPPYSKQQIKAAKHLGNIISEIKKSKSEEQGIKDARNYFDNISDINFRSKRHENMHHTPQPGTFSTSH